MALNWHVGNLAGSDYDEVHGRDEAGLKPRATGGSRHDGDRNGLGQDQSEIFTGTKPAPELKDARSVKGTPAETMQAFVLGEELAALADRDPRIVVLTADLASANRTVEFRERHPERFFDFGIAEKNMITAAAGMAVLRHGALCRDLRLVLGASSAPSRSRPTAPIRACRCASSATTPASRWAFTARATTPSRISAPCARSPT